MDQQQLQLILADHQLWLESDKEQGKRADLREANLWVANLQEANLREADLWRADLWRADLLLADSRGANLQEANLQEANLQGVDLRGANLRGANLRGANLRGANLRGAELLEAKLRGAELLEANLQETNLRETYLWRANLQEANLRGANLRGANLQEANLLEANLQEANLRETDLWSANLQEANLRGANLRGVKLDEAEYNLERLQMALNVPQKYLSNIKPIGMDVYQRRAKDAQSKVTALELEKRELESRIKAIKQGSAQSAAFKLSLEKAEVELSQVRSQLELNKQKRVALEELTDAIEPIMEAVESDKETVRAYKRQSRYLLMSGLTCFALATVFILGKAILSWQLPLATHPISSAHLLLQIAPGFVFAILGTALLRHDWKVRQLTLSLIDQNNSVDIAMGMLKTALRLSNIGEKKDIEGIPDLVKESFAEARRALLYRNRSEAPAPADDSGKDAAELIKQLKSLLPKSPSAGSTNTPSS